MNIQRFRTDFFRRRPILAALLAGIILVPAVHAQLERTVTGRFLFIFDTSSNMKTRVDATKKELDTLLATSLSGQLHSGDSIGVWTIGQTLRPGDYPLQIWDPDRAVIVASNLTRFVEKQHYTKTTQYAALQPLLNRVVQDSERLTIMIFCDGGTKMAGTPYDAAINGMFDQRKDEQKKTHQPFIIMLRSQRGQFVGGSVTAVPQTVVFPEFPPLPQPLPPPPPPKKTNIPPSPPTVMAPSLIIVGTNVENSLKPLNNQATVIPQSIPPAAPKTIPPPLVRPEPVTPTLVTTNVPATPMPAVTPAPAAVVTNTNVPEAAPTVTPLATVTPTNPVVTQAIAMPPTNLPEQKSASPSLPEPVEPAPSRQNVFLIIGAGLLVVAVGLGLFLWRRTRLANNNSLITRAMRDP